MNALISERTAHKVLIHCAELKIKVLYIPQIRKTCKMR